jgi:hypothetical protein
VDEQSDTWPLLRGNDRKSRHRRIKKHNFVRCVIETTALEYTFTGRRVPTRMTNPPHLLSAHPTLTYVESVQLRIDSCDRRHCVVTVPRVVTPRAITHLSDLVAKGL